MIKAIIIDDLSSDRNKLKEKIQINLPEVIELVGEAGSILEGMKLINSIKPDLVFLDYLLNPDGTGFDLLENIGGNNIKFDVIFTTQYDQYAIDAFDFSAIGYLLKPIDDNKLKEAFIRYQKKFLERTQIDVNRQHFYNYNNPDNEIILDGKAVKIKNIVYCQADEGSTYYFMKNGEKICESKPLKKTNEMLSKYPLFIRTHKSYLVNLEHIKDVCPNTCKVIMNNNSIIDISRRKKDKFIENYDAYRKNLDSVK